MTEPESEYVTINEAARILGVSSTQIRRLLVTGKEKGGLTADTEITLPSFSKPWRFLKRSDVIAYRDRRESKNAEKGESDAT